MERGVNSGMPLYGLTKGRQPNAERIRMTEKTTSQAEHGNPGWQALRKRQKGKNRTSKLEAQTPKVKPKRISPYLKGQTTERKKGERENLKPQTSNQRERETSKVEQQRGKRGKGKTSNLKSQISNQRGRETSKVEQQRGKKGKGKPQTSNLKSQIKGGGKPQRSNNREEKGGKENLKPQTSNLKSKIW